ATGVGCEVSHCTRKRRAAIWLHDAGCAVPESGSTASSSTPHSRVGGPLRGCCADTPLAPAVTTKPTNPTSPNPLRTPRRGIISSPLPVWQKWLRTRPGHRPSRWRPRGARIVRRDPQTDHRSTPWAHSRPDRAHLDDEWLLQLQHRGDRRLPRNDRVADDHPLALLTEHPDLHAE